MVYYDSDKSDTEMWVKLIIGIFGISYIVMIAAGTLAHHHPDLLHVLWRFSYWDWLLITIILTPLRGGKVSKWYRKED